MRSLAAGLCATLVSLNLASASDFVMVGKPGKMSAKFIGCRDKDHLQKLKSLIRAGDKDAAEIFLIRNPGACEAIPEGTVGTVESLSAWTASTCLRPRGEPDCLWVPTQFVVAP